MTLGPKLDPATLKRLRDALLDAFPTRSALAQMVRFGLDENLDALVAGGSLKGAVFELMGWAEAHGKLDPLLAAALDANPGNPLLAAFATQTVGAALPVPYAPPPLPAPSLSIHDLVAAATRTGIVSSRGALLSGLDPTFVAGLSLESSPTAQLLSDLNTLQRTGRLADHTYPLATWLQNALALVGPRVESALFRRALDALSPAPAPAPTPTPAPVPIPAPADPALLEIQEAYADRNLILFAGAGLSAAAGLPSWKRLVEHLVERARARGASASALQEIAELLAQNRLIDALSAVKDCLGAPDFGVAVERLLDDSACPLPEVAKAIAALAPTLRAVLTTNLDHFLERAFAGTWQSMARATGDIAQRRGYILKLHGTLIDRATWVLTRDDYDRALYADPRLQSAFSALFHACPLLFVGYGLADDDFDQILARVRALAGDQPPRHFALVAADTVTPHRRARLEKAGVRLVPYDNADGTHREVVKILRALKPTP